MNIHDKKPLILVDNISKYYGSFKALDSVRFTVKAGERVAVAGPSGSGKSSLLNSLAGVIHPEKGQVLVDGNDLAKLQSRKEMCRLVGIIHQQYDLVPQLPVIHNVLAGNLGRWGLFNSLLSNSFISIISSFSYDFISSTFKIYNSFVLFLSFEELLLNCSTKIDK